MELTNRRLQFELIIQARCRLYRLFFSVFFLLSLFGCEPPVPDTGVEVEVKIDDRLAGMSLAELQKASVDAQVDHEMALIQAKVNALLGPEALIEREQELEIESEWEEERAKEKEREQVVSDMPLESVEQAAFALRLMADTDPKKSYGLFLLAQRWMKYNDLDRAILYCRESEEFASRLTNPFEATMLHLDLSNLYFLLGKMEDASRCCDCAASLTDSISVPGQVATALLKLADVSLVVRLASQDGQASVKLLKIREMVIKAETFIKEQLLAASSSKDATAVGTEGLHDATQASVTGNYVQTGLFLTSAISLKELTDWTDALFVKIAKVQAWSSSLEEVGDTIHRITSGPMRDDALAATIDMLIVSGPQEQIPSWLDLISDSETKENVRRKVEKQQ